MENLSLRTYEAVSQFKSVRRAIRRGHISASGIIYPKRPFNNRSRTEGRKLQIEQERIYARIKRDRENLN